MSKAADYILWLPSWYPTKFDLFAGDFIQRHAVATSLYGAITVIHFAAPGEKVVVPQSHTTVSESGALKEIIVYMAFKPTGINIWDKVRYNLKFYYRAKKMLKQYFAEYGLPKKVHVHVPVKAGNVALWIQKKYGIDYVVSEHASYYMEEAENNFFQRHARYKQQVAKVFQKAIVVTNVSKAIGDVLERLFGLKNIRVIRNTVNTAYFNYSEPKPDVFTFIHVSTLSAQKNIMGILKTFARLRKIKNDWRFKIVGPAPETLRDFIQQNQLETYIELTGEMSYQEVAAHMKAAHALVLFSRHENFPCVVIEALCCGLPVLSSDVAGVREAVTDVSGILVPSEDEAALLQALIQLQETYNKYNRAAISQQAMQQYCYETIGRQIFNVYYP